MKPTHDDLAAQMAAFLASGGQVEQVDAIENTKVAQAAFYNATGKITKARYEKGTGKRASAWKMHLLMSSKR